MSNTRLLLVIGFCFLILLLLLGCGISLSQSTPTVVTQEVTRIVIATPTDTPSVITVTVIVVATPTTTTGMQDEATKQADPPASSTRIAGIASPTHTPISKTVPPTSERQALPIEHPLDDPSAGLVMLSEAAEELTAQGFHTLRLTLNLSVAVEGAVRKQQQADARLTSLLRQELEKHEISGNYVLDISLDDLAQQVWVIDGLGVTVGLGGEETVTWQQHGEKIRERFGDASWIERELTANEALLPLGNYLAVIDNYSHALNLSELIIDALRPLLLLSIPELGVPNQMHGWTEATDNLSMSSGFLAVRRERLLTQNNNLQSITASFANTGLSDYVDPVIITNGIQQTDSVEEAWLMPSTRLVKHGGVDIRGIGTVEFDYLGQHRFIDAVVTMSTENVFEFLDSVTIVVDTNN